jgi:hypothetical protein
MDGIPSQRLLNPPRAGALLAGLILLVAALCAGAIALPHSRYIRFQQFATGDFARVRWVYERLNYDRTPIDVAVFGTSRIEAAVSGPKVQKALTAAAGHPVHVANLAVPWAGRDTQLVLFRELLRTHPEVRLVVLEWAGRDRISHPAFRDIADWQSIVGAPTWINYYWLGNVAYLPLRNMSLFVQSVAPSLFGMTPRFDARHYARYRGADMDTTEAYRLDNDKLIEHARYANRDDLEKAVGGPKSPPHQPLLVRLTGGDADIIGTNAIAQISAELDRRCIGLVFLHVPDYKEGDLNQLGRPDAKTPILSAPTSIAQDWRDYINAMHLRTAGIARITAWLPQALQPYLGGASRQYCGTMAGKAR